MRWLAACDVVRVRRQAVLGVWLLFSASNADVQFYGLFGSCLAKPPRLPMGGEPGESVWELSLGPFGDYEEGNYLMKITLIAGAAAAIIAGSATADFVGYYDHDNWTFFSEAAGSFSGTETSLLLVGGDASLPGYTTYTIAAGGAGPFAFDWSYYTINSPGYDSVGYIVNGTYFELDMGYGPGSGSVSVDVGAGDEIGFYAYTSDGVFGAGELTITNFSAVPAPGALALLGLAGLAGRRRR